MNDQHLLSKGEFPEEWQDFQLGELFRLQTSLNNVVTAAPSTSDDVTRLAPEIISLIAMSSDGNRGQAFTKFGGQYVLEECLVLATEALEAMDVHAIYEEITHSSVRMEKFWEAMTIATAPQTHYTARHNAVEVVDSILGWYDVAPSQRRTVRLGANVADLFIETSAGHADVQSTAGTWGPNKQCKRKRRCVRTLGLLGSDSLSAIDMDRFSETVVSATRSDDYRLTAWCYVLGQYEVNSLVDMINLDVLIEECRNSGRALRGPACALWILRLFANEPIYGEELAAWANEAPHRFANGLRMLVRSIPKVVDDQILEGLLVVAKNGTGRADRPLKGIAERRPDLLDTTVIDALLSREMYLSGLQALISSAPRMADKRVVERLLDILTESDRNWNDRWTAAQILATISQERPELVHRDLLDSAIAIIDSYTGPGHGEIRKSMSETVIAAATNRSDLLTREDAVTVASALTDAESVYGNRLATILGRMSESNHDVYETVLLNPLRDIHGQSSGTPLTDTQSLSYLQTLASEYSACLNSDILDETIAIVTDADILLENRTNAAELLSLIAMNRPDLLTEELLNTIETTLSSDETPSSVLSRVTRVLHWVAQHRADLLVNSHIELVITNIETDRSRIESVRTLSTIADTRPDAVDTDVVALLRDVLDSESDELVGASLLTLTNLLPKRPDLIQPSIVSALLPILSERDHPQLKQFTSEALLEIAKHSQSAYTTDTVAVVTEWVMPRTVGLEARSAIEAIEGARVKDPPWYSTVRQYMIRVLGAIVTNQPELIGDRQLEILTDLLVDASGHHNEIREEAVVALKKLVEHVSIIFDDSAAATSADIIAQFGEELDPQNVEFTMSLLTILGELAEQGRVDISPAHGDIMNVLMSDVEPRLRIQALSVLI